MDRMGWPLYEWCVTAKALPDISTISALTAVSGIT
ncbi:Transposase [Shigella dysenteriae 1617]|uniref:Transposase n=1 Tax=Shigella dysenteriae 1617 TaxID=754093 RepID=A0A0A6ZNN8_SHIDY|nr:Transposase [Shigella dysenteriae 1617]